MGEWAIFWLWLRNEFGLGCHSESSSGGDPGDSNGCGCLLFIIIVILLFRGLM